MVGTISTSPGGGAGFSHEAAFYRGADDLGRTVLPFIRAGVARREPVLVALTADKLDAVERALGADATRVDFVDMAELGANPACIIPEWQRFLDDTGDAGPVRGVGEPAWHGRRDVELEEAALHEALLNVAFDGGPAWRLLCPYDVAALPPEVVAEARRNHPVVHPAADRGGEPGRHEPGGYEGPGHALDAFAARLPEPPVDATRWDFGRGDLGLLRKLLRDAADDAGLHPSAGDSLVLAAHELAANSVLHGGGSGSMAVWREPEALLVEVRDPGRIADPLVGRGRLDPAAESGRGIWMANQLCDLVQVRSGDTGTQVRLWAWL